MNEEIFINQDAFSFGGSIIGMIIGSIIGGIGMFLMARKAGYELAWLAFIPFLIWIPLLKVIKRSLWNVLLMLIPIVNIIFGVIWAIEIQKVFGRSGWMVLLVFFVPFFGFFYYIYLGVSENVKYEG